MQEMESFRHSVYNFFSTYGLDRLTDKRRDDAWLAAQLENEATLFVPVWNLKNLFTREPVAKPVFLPFHEVQTLLPQAESTTLLGIKAQRAYFALGLSSPDRVPPDGLAEWGEFRDLRQAAPLLDEKAGALLAYARAMVYWNRHHRFCGACGSPTRSTGGGSLRVCSNSQCGEHHFPRTDPAIIVLVTCEERCLLGRKAMWPAGMYSCVSGFVEPGETLEDAVVREVCEETAVAIKHMHYHSSQPWPFPSSLMLGFTAEAADWHIRVDGDELENARWFSREEIRDGLGEGSLRLPSPVSVSYRLIEDWFNAGSCGPLKNLIDSL
jgi:NAD+ diphosphatase